MTSFQSWFYFLWSGSFGDTSFQSDSNDVRMWCGCTQTYPRVRRGPRPVCPWVRAGSSGQWCCFLPCLYLLCVYFCSASPSSTCELPAASVRTDAAQEIPASCGLTRSDRTLRSSVKKKTVFKQRDVRIRSAQDASHDTDPTMRFILILIWQNETN